MAAHWTLRRAMAVCGSVSHHEWVRGLFGEMLAQELPQAIDALSRIGSGAAQLTFSNRQNLVAANLADSYMGLYVLMEKISRSKNRHLNKKERVCSVLCRQVKREG